LAKRGGRFPAMNIPEYYFDDMFIIGSVEEAAKIFLAPADY